MSPVTYRTSLPWRQYSNHTFCYEFIIELISDEYSIPMKVLTLNNEILGGLLGLTHNNMYCISSFFFIIIVWATWDFVIPYEF